MRLSGEVATMNADKCTGKLLLGKSDTRHLEYKRLDRKENIKTDVKR
jgi:hypothetical protein